MIESSRMNPWWTVRLGQRCGWALLKEKDSYGGVYRKKVAENLSASSQTQTKKPISCTRKAKSKPCKSDEYGGLYRKAGT